MNRVAPAARAQMLESPQSPAACFALRRIPRRDFHPQVQAAIDRDPVAEAAPASMSWVITRFDPDNAMDSASIKPVLSRVMADDRWFRDRPALSAWSIAAIEEEE